MSFQSLKAAKAARQNGRVGLQPVEKPEQSTVGSTTPLVDEQIPESSSLNETADSQSEVSKGDNEAIALALGSGSDEHDDGDHASERSIAGAGPSSLPSLAEDVAGPSRRSHDDRLLKTDGNTTERLGLKKFGLEVRLTKQKGRGLFTTKRFKAGELRPSQLGQY